MDITIKLPDVVNFESNGQKFAFGFGEVQADKLADFVVACTVAGIMKAGVDAAASAKTYAEENKLSRDEAVKTLVEKWLKVWRAGDWSSRGAGTGESAEMLECLSMLRSVVKEGNKAKYKNASPEERDAMVRKAWTELTDAKREAYMKTAIKRLEVKAQAAAELAALETGVEI